MNKNFSERLNALKSAVFGVKEIVEDSILSDFKNQDPKSSEIANSAESVKEIIKTKESIPEADKNEGIQAMMNFSEDEVTYKDLLSNLIENEVNELVKFLEDTKNESVESRFDKWESIVNTNPILKNVDKASYYNLGASIGDLISDEDPILDEILKHGKSFKNFANEDKDDKSAHANDDKYYDLFKKYLMAATKKEHFDNYMAISTNLGLVNRILKDSNFIKDFESGKNIKDESKKSDIIKFRKGLIKYIKSAKDKADKSIDKSSKEIGDKYVADSKLSGDAKKLAIAVKRAILSGDVDALSTACKILIANKLISKDLTSDTEFDKEVKTMVSKKSFADTGDDDVVKLANSFPKEYKKELDKIHKDTADQTEDELNKKIKTEKDTLGKFIKSPRNGGFYISPEDSKKINKKAAEDMLSTKDSTLLSDNVKIYLLRKIAKKNKKSSEELDLEKEKELVEANLNKAASDSRFKLAKAAIGGMDEPARSFVEGIIDLFKSKSDVKYGQIIAPLLKASEENSKDLPKELDIKDDDIELADENETKSFSESNDPMSSIVEGHIETSSTKNFSVSEEFKKYEESLNQLWDFK